MATTNGTVCDFKNTILPSREDCGIDDTLCKNTLESHYTNPSALTPMVSDDTTKSIFFDLNTQFPFHCAMMRSLL